MVFTKNLVAVCAGRDAVRAAEQGLQVLHLCMGVSASGALERRRVPGVQRGCFLGLCDSPGEMTLCDPERLAADLVFEARRVNAPGVFADFEHETASSLALLRAFDEALDAEGIPLFVPVSIGRSLDHAVLTASTALSGETCVREALDCGRAYVRPPEREKQVYLEGDAAGKTDTLFAILTGKKII